MKTTFKITIIATALSIIASSSLWAAPYSKQMADSPEHPHETKKCCSKANTNDTVKKPIGPASKRF